MFENLVIGSKTYKNKYGQRHRVTHNININYFTGIINVFYISGMC